MQYNNIRFPLFIDIKDKNILVVGGGNIASRRVKTLIEFECNITVISTNFSQYLLELELSNKVKLINREFIETDLNNIFLVTATTDNREVNQNIGRLARQRNIYVSVADAKEESNFYFPAIATFDNTIIAVGSNGTHHTLVSNLAKTIREHNALLTNERPLTGKKILVTSPSKSKSVILDKLNQLGAVVDYCPTIDIVATEFELPILEEYSWIVFTSSAGVNIFCEKYKQNELDARVFANNKFAVVGSQTAKTLQSYGIIADFVPQSYSGDSMLKELVINLTDKDKLLLIRPKTATKDLLQVLEQNKIKYATLSIYETKPATDLDLSKIMEVKDYDYVTFTSSSCVDNFYKEMLSNKLNPSDVKYAVCIGEKTTKTAKEYTFNTLTAKISTIDALIETIVEHSKNKK